MSKPKTKPSPSKSKPSKPGKPKPKPPMVLPSMLPSMTPTAAITGIVTVVPGTRAAATERETLALTIRLPQAYRARIDEIATSSGVSVNALFQQLFDRYGTKIDLGPRLDAVEERLTKLEAQSEAQSDPLPLFEALGKIVERVPSVPAEPTVRSTLEGLPPPVVDGFNDLYISRLDPEHMHKFSAVFTYNDSVMSALKEISAFGATLEEVTDNLLVKLREV